MKVTPVSTPQLAPPQPTTTNTDSRARAIEKFLGQAAQTPPAPATAAQPPTPVPNPSQVSPEELGAVQAPLNASPAPAPTEPAADAPSQSVASAQTPTEEPPKPERRPQDDPAVRRHLDQLARQEKAFRVKIQQQETALKAREAKIAEQEAKYKQGYVSLEDIKANPLAIIANAGISFDEVTQQLLNQAPTDPRVNATISRLEAKIQDLEAKAQASQEAAKTAQQQQYDAALKQIRTDVRTLVTRDPSYEMIRATGSVGDVVELIQQTYEKDGIILSTEDACREVESYLEDETVKLTKLQKIQKRTATPPAGAPTATPPQTQPAAAQPQTRPMSTLTNAAATTRKLSNKERAILAFKGELKG